jgi:hypothetical protein
MLKTVTNIINASQIQTPITLPGDVTLSTGNLVIGTSGKGIDFSATPGTGTSELFSDYEEGTWTPVLTFTTPGDLNPVYTYQTGVYRKIGSMVYVDFAIAITGANWVYSTSSGSALITGLPYSAPNAQNQGAGDLSSWEGITLAAGYTQVIVQNRTNTSQLYIVANGSTKNQAVLGTAALPSGTGKYIYGSICYITP